MFNYCYFNFPLFLHKNSDDIVNWTFRKATNHNLSGFCIQSHDVSVYCFIC